MAEINQEEFPDDEDEEEEEEETDAKERLRTAVTEKYEEQAESISNIQVCCLLYLYEVTVSGIYHNTPNFRWCKFSIFHKSL